jgi:hypothetical protein
MAKQASNGKASKFESLPVAEEPETVAAKAKPPKQKRPRGTTSQTFIGLSELAYELHTTTPTLNRWVLEGRVPPPHSRPGKHSALWLRKHYQHFVNHKECPQAAYPTY